MALLGLVLLLWLLLLLLVLLLMTVGLERAQHEYEMSNEQALNIRFQAYYDYISKLKLFRNNLTKYPAVLLWSWVTAVFTF